MRVIFQFLPNVNNYLELQERFNASTGEYEQALNVLVTVTLVCHSSNRAQVM